MPTRSYDAEDRRGLVSNKHDNASSGGSPWAIVLIVIIIVGVALGLGLGLGLSSKSSSSSDGGTLPQVKPPVVASTPTGMGGSGAAAAANSGFKMLLDSFFSTSSGTTTLDPDDIKQRFFTAGPTDVYALLQTVDDRINGINDRIHQFADCLATRATPYNLNAWIPTPTFYAQCSETWQDNSGFDQVFEFFEI